MMVIFDCLFQAAAADEYAKAMNAPIKSKRCGDGCQCLAQNVQEMRDSASNGSEHRVLLTLGKLSLILL